MRIEDHVGELCVGWEWCEDVGYACWFCNGSSGWTGMTGSGFEV
jgi:hypothetical protein